MPRQYPGLSTLTYWAIGLASAIILFASILIHELSHSYVAKKNGLPIARITLFFFGGVSEMTQEPQDAGLEVRMAAAGPLMSYLIAGVLGASWYVCKIANAPVAVTATLSYAALINAILGTFNLLPAFPLDGGRVLRGSMWKRSKNLVGATRTATRLSEIFSLLMMFGGIILIFTQDFVDGLWVIVLGLFIRSGAETSLRQTLVGEVLTGVKVSDIMTGNVLTVSPDITVQQLITDYFLIYHHGGYPVVKNGAILGVITLQGVRSVPKEKREQTLVQEVMIPSERGVVVDPSTGAMDAMSKMASNNVGSIVVADQGRLLGIVTREDIARAIQMRQQFGIGTSQSYSTSSTPQGLLQGERCIQCGAALQTQTRFCPFCGARQTT
jgi:Zn-dependent protease